MSWNSNNFAVQFKNEDTIESVEKEDINTFLYTLSGLLDSENFVKWIKKMKEASILLEGESKNGLEMMGLSHLWNQIALSEWQAQSLEELEDYISTDRVNLDDVISVFWWDVASFEFNSYEQAIIVLFMFIKWLIKEQTPSNAIKDYKQALIDIDIPLAS